MKHFSILGGRAHVVELPIGSDKTVAYGLTSRTPYINWMGDDGNLVEIILPPGTWQIVGMMAEVMEEDVFDIVDWYHVSDNMDLTSTYAFKDYVNGEDDAEDYWDEYMLDTAIESLESAIVAEGYAFQSAPKPENKNFYWGYLEDLAKWEAAQSRVLSRERTLILRSVEG